MSQAPLSRPSARAPLRLHPLIPLHRGEWSGLWLRRENLTLTGSHRRSRAGAGTTEGHFNCGLGAAGAVGLEYKAWGAGKASPVLPHVPEQRAGRCRSPQAPGRGRARRGRGGSGWWGRVVQTRARESGGGRTRGAGVGGERRSGSSPRATGPGQGGESCWSCSSPPSLLLLALRSPARGARRRLSCPRWWGGLQALLLCPPVCQTRGKAVALLVSGIAGDWECWSSATSQLSPSLGN